MAFFNADFTDELVHSTWAKREKEMRAEQLQPYNNHLYEVVRESILLRRDEIHSALLARLSVAENRSELHIPLWSYYTSHYQAPIQSIPFEVFEESEQQLRNKGYHWLVGLAGSGFNIETFPFDSEDWYTMWHENPRSVHDVVRHTDFMRRIALLFGDNFFRVSYQVSSRKVLTDPVGVVVEKVDLMLHYHPNGLYVRTSDALFDTKAKYEDHVYDCAAWNAPFVWEGMPPERAASNVTPVAAPMPTDPPPLMRRSNGHGMDQESMREVARTLFEAEGAVGSYPPPPCHCGYHHESDEE